MRPALVALAGFLACSEPAISAGAGYAAFYPADAARGSKLAAGCLACHGSPLTVLDGVHVPKLRGQKAESIFAALLEYRNGTRASRLMAAIAATLSNQQMRDVAASVAGDEIRPSLDAVPESWAQRRVHEDCAACHGETGLGVMPGYPVLGGQYEDYLAQQLKRFREGERQNSTMNVMARQLSDEQIHDLAQYFAERGYLRVAQ